jgi:hypothetical protein
MGWDPKICLKNGENDGEKMFKKTKTMSCRSLTSMQHAIAA